MKLEFEIRAIRLGSASAGSLGRRSARLLVPVALCILAATPVVFGQASSAGRAAPAQTTPAASPDEAEARVVTYIGSHLKPGQPLLVTQLYNEVFTAPTERQALDKLYRAFFRIPLFVAEYQQRFGHPPTLAAIGEQFDLHAPGAADVLLRVMESDPRVPKFLTRDPKTGEITQVDVAAIRADQRFGSTVERQLSGWEGKPAPRFVLPGLAGGSIDSKSLDGKPGLIYVWFTGCPPCMKETPVLVGLSRQLGKDGLTILGANADHVLGLSYSDDVRQRYLREHNVDFTVGHWTKDADVAYGGIAIFPAIFLVDAKGTIRQHWVGFVSGDDLRAAIKRLTPAN